MSQNTFQKHIWSLPDINTFAGLKECRIWLINSMMLFVIIGLPISLLFSLPIFFQEKMNLLIAMDAILYLVVCVAFFLKKGAMKIVPYVWMLFLYTLLISFFLKLGPHYARSAWLVMAAVMAALFFGTRASILATLFNALLLFVIYFMVAEDNPAWLDVLQAPFGKWVMFVVNVTLITLISSFPVGFLFKRLDIALAHERDISQKLLAGNTKLKKAEAGVQNHINNLQTIFNSTPNILALVNAQGEVENINHQGIAFTGERKKNLLGRLIGEVFHCINAFDEDSCCGRSPECPQCPIRTRIQTTFRTGHPIIEGEAHMAFFLDGVKTPVDLLISTDLLRLNDIPKVLLSLTDITKRTLAEKALVESEQKFRLAFHTSPDAINLNRVEDGLYIEINKGFTEIMGYTREEIVGKTSMELNIWKHAEERNRLVHELSQKGSVRNFEAHFVAKDRSIKVGLMSANILKINNEDVIISMTRDNTERKLLDERIQQAQKMESMGNLAGGIAHDFNNLLFPIIGMAELLLEDLPPHSLEYDNAHEILKAGRRGSKLVKQILAFSRQNEHDFTPVRVQSIIEEVLKLSRASIPTNIKIRQNLQPDCRLVLADSTQLHQIAMNLITNAYHAVEDTGGEIDVHVREVSLTSNESIGLSLKPGKYVMLSVEDNGVGIVKENFKKIFDPYFTTKKKGKGTGLGLSVVFGIVKEHKGDVKVSSEPGKGTIFQIYLPIMKHADVPVPVCNNLSLEPGTERILLVDDEAPIANLGKETLERLGYSVSIQTSSIKALEAFKADPDAHDLVISDISMPNMTGDQLAKEFLRIRPGLPIILCTGFTERINEKQAKDFGVKGFLMKPIFKSAMAQEIRRVLDEGKE